MTSNLPADDLARLKALLKRKLQNVPEHVIPDLTIQDILYQSSRPLKLASVPADLQLPFLLRNRALIDCHGGRPIKDELKQSTSITRAIFFYQLHQPHQFQRYHDLSRWNLAFFTAVLCTPPNSTASRVQSSRNTIGRVYETRDVSRAAYRFMVSYIAAVLEHHNTPTVFDKREDFVRLWKDSRWDVFERLGASQKKLLKREMPRLNTEWALELDRAIKAMGRTEYDTRVAKFVGCVVPGRKDQGLRMEYRGATGLADESFDMELKKAHANELLDALRVPLGEEEYQGNGLVDEDTATPVDVSYAITCMQNVRPRDVLPILLELFPTKKKAN
jgi:hypothetical protein